MPLQNLNEIRCVIDEEGSIFKERIIRTKVSINEDDCISELSKGRNTKIPNIMELPDKTIVGAAVSASCDEIVFTAEITELVLLTTYNLHEGIMTPTFYSKPEPNIPSLPIVWNVNQATGGTLRLFLLVGIKKSSYGDGFMAEDHRLVSASEDGRLWRMPLPNVHTDCRVCTGKYESVSRTATGALIKALSQFKNSSWNSDLLASPAKTKSFFRFKPVEDRFDTIVTESEPMKLCECVSAPELENIAYRK